MLDTAFGWTVSSKAFTRKIAITFDTTWHRRRSNSEKQHRKWWRGREKVKANKINDNECLTNWHFRMKLDIHGANWAYIILSAMIWWVSECMRWHFVIYISGRFERDNYARRRDERSNRIFRRPTATAPSRLSIDFHISMRQQSLFNAFKAHSICYDFSPK